MYIMGIPASPIKHETDGFGNNYWYKNGERHRDGGPAIELADGTKHWYKNGIVHRDDGHAIEYADGSKFWYKNGVPHREDGPSGEYTNGSIAWHVNGQRCDFDEWCNLLNKTEEEIATLKMKFMS